jgi:hypothetical protein
MDNYFVKLVRLYRTCFVEMFSSWWYMQRLFVSFGIRQERFNIRIES